MSKSSKFDPKFGAIHIKSKSSINYNLPNILTISRMAFVPVFFLSCAYDWNASAFTIFVLSSITDYIDGYIARKYDMGTVFGAFLDPVADKVLVCTALITLLVKYPFYWFGGPVALLVTREIVVSAIREFMAERGLRSSVKVSNIGKWKTAFQMIALSILLLVSPGIAADYDICKAMSLPKEILFNVGMIFFFSSVVLSTVSGFEYFIAALPSLKS